MTDNATALVIAEVPAVWYALGIGFALLVVSFWVRSILIYGAILLCICGVVFSESITDRWVISGLTLVILWCIFSMIKQFRKGES